MLKNLGLFVLCVLAALAFSSVRAAPKAELWEYWADFERDSVTSVSHEKWQLILDRYLVSDTVDGVNKFAYADVTAADKRQLDAYLNELTEIDPRQLAKPEQFAYWVNLYNALTVDLVLDKYPVSSIKKIRFWSSLFGPWDKKLVEVAGQSLSLNDIEHRILRPLWQEPRIHFVVNCASIGCPNLLATALTRDNAETLLEQAAVAFVNHSRGAQRDGDTLILSSIFDWYQSDFGATEKALIDYLNRYLADQDKSMLNDFKQLEFRYDWSLNDAN